MTLPDDDQVKAMLEARASQGPGDPLPEVILERVLAAGPAPASVPGWQRLGLTMAAGLIVAVGAGLFLSGRLAGPGQPAHTGPPQTSSPAAGASSVSPEPSRAGGPLQCDATMLRAEILDWQGAAGNRVGSIRATNVGPSSCMLAGMPEVQLLDAQGRVLIDSSDQLRPRASADAGDSPASVDPGASAMLQVDASNYCGPAPSQPVSVGLVLAGNAARLIAAPASGAGGLDGVPPCLGSVPAVISSSGWTAGH